MSGDVHLQHRPPYIKLCAAYTDSYAIKPRTGINTGREKKKEVSLLEELFFLEAIFESGFRKNIIMNQGGLEFYKP